MWHIKMEAQAPDRLINCTRLHAPVFFLMRFDSFGVILHGSINLTNVDDEPGSVVEVATKRRTPEFF